MRLLQDRTTFIINIYQQNKFLQSVISIPKQCKIYMSSWNSFSINMGGWARAGDYNIQITNICRITTCSERSINRVHLTFSLYTNCQNRPCGKDVNTTAFVYLHIYYVYVNIILWRNLNIVFTKVFSHSDNEYTIQILYYKKNIPLLNWSAWTATASECSVLSANHDGSATKSIEKCSRQ